jgi:hypothetical protein
MTKETLEERASRIIAEMQANAPTPEQEAEFERKLSAIIPDGPYWLPRKEFLRVKAELIKAIPAKPKEPKRRFLASVRLPNGRFSTVLASSLSPASQRSALASKSEQDPPS